MKFAFYSSLKAGAKRAFNKGNGKHGKYLVDGNYIAVADKQGRALDWILVVKVANGTYAQPIEGISS